MFSKPQKIDKTLSIHQDDRKDPYFWMNERDTRPVLDYLESENRRTQETLKETEELQKTLVTEMRARIKEDDASVPVPSGGYFYYGRYEKGQEYPIYARKKGSLDAAEEILTDGNVLSQATSYFDMTSPDPSPNHELIGFAVDTRGRRFYDLHFKNVKTGETLKDVIKDTTGDFVWGNDGRTILYARQHPETLRSYQIWRSVLGSDRPPELVYEETDETYSAYVSKTKTDRWILMTLVKRDCTEIRVLDANHPSGVFEAYHPREDGLEYSLEDSGSDFYILTNWDAPNHKIMRAAYDARSKDKWSEVIGHDAHIYRESMDVYRSHFVIEERENGLTQIRIVGQGQLKQRILKFNDPAYVVEPVALPEFASPVFRFTYESLNQPETVFEETFESEERTARKVKEVSTYQADQYTSQRVFATAHDGTRIPISILMKRGTQLNGENPLLLYGYGSYGLCVEPYFRGNVISLVDRGFIFAIAHIRGGSEMGREWYEEGRLQNKRNTFTDFIESAQYLISESYTSAKHLYAMGGSAGGLLMGAVVNMRPEIFNGVVAAVPFVDVVTTMLDESIPLTTSEYREWGDPRKKEDYDYIKSYSPYDNVEAKEYPNLLVTTGYHDSQVQYWEPAKWVAKLRDLKTDKNLLLLHTEMSAGHSGASGRFEALKTVALEYSFFLHLEGVAG